MKSEDVLRLLDAGFTKAEIDAMLMPEPVIEPEPAPAEPEPEEPAAEPEPEPVENTGNNELQETLSGFMADLKQSISDLTAAVQAKNIQNNSVDTTKAEDLNAVLATYINPPGREPK